MESLERPLGISGFRGPRLLALILIAFLLSPVSSSSPSSLKDNPVCDSADEASGACRTPPAPAVSPRLFRQLKSDRAGSHRCGIQVSRQFLDDTEVEHVLSLLRESGGWAPSATGGPSYQVPRRPDRWRALLQRDPVIARIERRIANVTGVPY